MEKRDNNEKIEKFDLKKVKKIRKEIEKNSDLKISKIFKKRKKEIMKNYYNISFIASSTTCMSSVGSNLATTSPFLSIRNLVKFHLISELFS